jgi:hypothetical protein
MLGPTKAGLDECEASLHEDDEHRADDDPQEVGLRPESRHRSFCVEFIRSERGNAAGGDHRAGRNRRGNEETLRPAPGR